MIDEQDERKFEEDTTTSVQVAIAELIKAEYDGSDDVHNAFVKSIRISNGYYDRKALKLAKKIIDLNNFLYGPLMQRRGMDMSRALVENESN